MNIRTLRESRNLSQQTLADKAGLAQSQISRIERGIIDTPVSTLRRVAMALDVPVSALLDDHAKDTESNAA